MKEMIHEYKCKNCMRLTVVSLPPYIERKSITCEHCNGEAVKNGEILLNEPFFRCEKIPKREKK